jgi:ribose-phosphate pyrophosphokinase
MFGDDAVAAVLAAGADRLVSCNTLPHPTNVIDVTDALAASVQVMVDGPR